MAKKPSSAPAGSVRITSTKAGFRRAGIAHPAEAVDYPAGTFTEEQLAQLKAEPALIVEETAEAAPEPDKKQKSPAKAGEEAQPVKPETGAGGAGE